MQLSDGAQGEGHADDNKLHGKPDKTLRFSLCSDNLEGISEGQYSIFTPSLLHQYFVITSSVLNHYIHLLTVHVHIC